MAVQLQALKVQQVGRAKAVSICVIVGKRTREGKGRVGL